MLGHGGQGVVYEAHDPELDRNVAIKLLAAGPGRRDAKARLLREAMALARLSHPNVVGIHHVGQCTEGVYLVTQLVDGSTLSAWLRARRSWREIVDVFVAAGRGLLAAHQRGIVHRDFKPTNVLVGTDGVARLLDFGLARDAAHHEPGTESRAWDPTAASVTLDGHVMGTPAYMAPEQHEGKPATAAADQYAFCIALFEALWGARPFTARDVANLATQKRTGALEFPRHDRLPRPLRAIVAKGLRPRPEERWPSMRDLVTALERVASPRRRVWRSVALVGGFAAVMGWAVRADGDPPLACATSDAWTEVWSPSRASALASAFAATERSYADHAAQRVRERVEAFGAEWIAERENACAQLDVDPNADVRLACLDVQLDELAAAVSVLEEATPGAVEHAAETIAALPSPRRCATPDGEEAPPEIADVVARIHRSIARAEALYRAGRYDEAADEIAGAEETAIAVGHASSIARAALTRSTILQGIGAYEKSGAQGEYAYFTAQAEGLDALAFEAAWGMALSIRLVGGDDAEADAWARRAEGTLARRGDAADPKDAGKLEYMFAALALQRGEFTDALAHAQEATAIFERELGRDDHRVTATRVAAATALAELHRLDEAEEEARRAIASAEASVGPEHPFTADALMLLAIVSHLREELDDALTLYRRVLAIQEAALDPSSPALATTWLNIGNAESDLGRLPAAERAFRRALEITHASLGADNPACVPILHDLALTLASMGEHEQAIAIWHEALDIGRRHLGPDHPRVADALAALGELLVEKGRSDEARPMLEQALAIRSATLDATDPLLVDTARSLERAAG